MRSTRLLVVARVACLSLLLAPVCARTQDRTPRPVLLANRAEKLESGAALAGQARPPPLGSLKGGSSDDKETEVAVERSLEHKAAVRNTIWSFAATIVFGMAVVLPLKGAEGCINFFTARRPRNRTAPLRPTWTTHTMPRARRPNEAIRALPGISGGEVALC